MGARRKPVTLVQLAAQAGQPIERIVGAAREQGLHDPRPTMRVTAGQARAIIDAIGRGNAR